MSGAEIKRCGEQDFGSGTLTKQFFAMGQTLSGSNYFYMFDHLGSIRGMTDSSGNVVAQYQYGMYGQPTQTIASQSADFGYAGMYFHQPSGLNLATFRAYNPTLGRWINRDPMEEKGGLNLYDYVNNNPASFTDPSGTFIPVLIGIGIGLGESGIGSALGAAATAAALAAAAALGESLGNAAGGFIHQMGATGTGSGAGAGAGGSGGRFCRRSGCNDPPVHLGSVVCGNFCASHCDNETGLACLAKCYPNGHLNPVPGPTLIHMAGLVEAQAHPSVGHIIDEQSRI